MSFGKVAKILGFNDTQTLHFATARLRAEILGARENGAAEGEAPYAPLSAGQFLELRLSAREPRGKPIRNRPATLDMSSKSGHVEKTKP